MRDYPVRSFNEFMLLEKHLDTPRLTLRNLKEEDVQSNYLKWLVDPEVNRFLEVRFEKNQSLEKIRGFVKSINDSKNDLLLGLFEREGGCHIGNIRLGPCVKEHARSPIGYLIGEKKYWGKGYATEAIQRVVRYGFESLGLEKVTAGCYENNLGSSKALEKCGFTLEGRMPRSVIFDNQRIASLMFGIDQPL
jgi:RimJ/RimL family protein N-acetyltransferase